MADIARGRGVLLLCVLVLRRRLHLDLTLHVGLFDHLHLRQRQTVGGGASACDGATAASGGLIRTSSLGLMLYSILSAFSLSWRLSMIARSSLEALFCKEAVEGEQSLTASTQVFFFVFLKIMEHFTIEFDLTRCRCVNAITHSVTLWFSTAMKMLHATLQCMFSCYFPPSASSLTCLIQSSHHFDQNNPLIISINAT